MAYIPTTAGTGSEVTQYSILTNDKAKTKTSIATELIFPTVTFLDAKTADIKRENANINGNTAMGTMLQYGSTVSKEFCKSLLNCLNCHNNLTKYCISYRIILIWCINFKWNVLINYLLISK